MFIYYSILFLNNLEIMKFGYMLKKATKYVTNNDFNIVYNDNCPAREQ